MNDSYLYRSVLPAPAGRHGGGGITPHRPAPTYGDLVRRKHYTCPVPAAPGLAPGASETCTGNTPHTVTQADVVAGHVSDTATATGTDAAGQTSPPSGSSTATVETAPSPEQPLTSIITGHGWWGPTGPSGRLDGLVGLALLLAGLGLVGVRRHRKLAAR